MMMDLETLLWQGGGGHLAEQLVRRSPPLPCAVSLLL